MTLGGLALAVGILVDEATVEVENIHTQMLHHENVARAVRLGNQETAVPRLLAMLCILAVFVPSFFMEGAARELFVPLSLAVGYAMIASYSLSSTFVPVLSVWLLKPASHHAAKRRWMFDRLLDGYEATVARVVHQRWLVVPVYMAVVCGAVYLLYSRLGTADRQGSVQAAAESPERHPHRADRGTDPGSDGPHQERSRRAERDRNGWVRGDDPYSVPGAGAVPVDERA
jgi:multidrug efflux pump subunit AcrB